MKKLSKTFWYLLGSFMAFALNLMGISAAQMQVGSGQAGPEEYGEIAYGIAPRFIQTGTWAKILSMIFSPVVIIIIIILAFVLGAIIFIRRRNKNPKKKS